MFPADRGQQIGDLWAVRGVATDLSIEKLSVSVDQKIAAELPRIASWNQMDLTSLYEALQVVEQDLWRK